MNKRDFNTNFKYFFKVILIAFIPLMVVMYFIQMYVKNNLINWLLTIVLVGAVLFIAMIYQNKKQKKEQEDKQNGKKKFDPYSD